MAAKVHCDVCDSTDAATSSTSDYVTIVINGLRHEVKVSASFLPRYDNEDAPRKDLCTTCKRAVFEALFVKYGGGKGLQL